MYTITEKNGQVLSTVADIEAARLLIAGTDRQIRYSQAIVETYDDSAIQITMANNTEWLHKPLVFTVAYAVTDEETGRVADSRRVMAQSSAHAEALVSAMLPGAEIIDSWRTSR